jgi:hypothetical protein
MTMTTRATTWAAQLALVLVMLMAATASASSGLLSGNSCRDKNALKDGFRRDEAAVIAAKHRSCGECCSRSAADFVVAPAKAAVARGTLTGSLDGLTAAEKGFVEDLLSKGKNVEVVPRGVGRTPDFKIDGVQTELKTLSGVAKQTPDGLSAAMASRIMDGRGQAAQIIVDARGQAGMTKEIAERGIKRAFGADNATGKKIQSIRVIGDGFDITVPRMP